MRVRSDALKRFDRALSVAFFSVGVAFVLQFALHVRGGLAAVFAFVGIGLFAACWVAGVLLAITTYEDQVQLPSGHRVGQVRPAPFRAVARAHVAPRPVQVRTRLLGARQKKPGQNWVADEVGRALGPLSLERIGLVLYRDTEQAARSASVELQRVLDNYFPAPVEIGLDRWNSELGVWQDADLAGGDRATFRRMSWEVRIQCQDRKAARSLAEQIRRDGEVMVGWRRRRVFVAVEDPNSAKAVAAAPVRIRKLTGLRRWRLLQLNLYERRIGRLTSGFGWLVWTESDD